MFEEVRAQLDVFFLNVTFSVKIFGTYCVRICPLKPKNSVRPNLFG